VADDDPELELAVFVPELEAAAFVALDELDEPQPATTTAAKTVIPNRAVRAPIRRRKPVRPLRVCSNDPIGVPLSPSTT
jgi:hypothetical protein